MQCLGRKPIQNTYEIYNVLNLQEWSGIVGEKRNCSMKKKYIHFLELEEKKAVKPNSFVDDLSV